MPLLAALLLAALVGQAHAGLEFRGIQCDCELEWRRDPQEVLTRATCTLGETGTWDALLPVCACWPAGVVPNCVTDPTVENGGVVVQVARRAWDISALPCSNPTPGQNRTCSLNRGIFGAVDGCPGRALTEELEEWNYGEDAGRVAYRSHTRTHFRAYTDDLYECDCQWTEFDSGCVAWPTDPCFGNRTITRVVAQPDNGHPRAVKCPDPLVTSEYCIPECDRDCAQGAWYLDTAHGCLGGCGGPGAGRGLELRDTLVTPRGNGAACGPSSRQVACDLPACVCTYTPWSNGACNATCGTGAFTRTRAITSGHTEAQCNGALSETVPCAGLEPCGNDCVLGAWGEWDACSKPCGLGSQRRRRNVTQEPSGDGAACGALSEVQPCNEQPCPVDCEVGAWGEWEACSAPCDNGTQSRRRVAVRPPSGGGASCPPLIEARVCSLGACNCTVTAWGEWSECSRMCGGGTRSRVRSVVVAGPSCGNNEELQLCNSHECSRDCEVSAWTSWSPCSDVCGSVDAVQRRSRDVVRPAAGAGLACPPLQETRACGRDRCPQTACEMGPFAEHGCSQPCGPANLVGANVRVRDITRYGRDCGTRVELTQCPAAQCAPPGNRSCEPGYWGPWSTCEAPGDCGIGVRRRNRTLTGACLAVPGLRATEEVACDTGRVCRHDCALSAWSAWSNCSAACGGTGSQFRTRHVVEHPIGEGATACGATLETRSCNADPCPRPCEHSPWGDWSSCSAPCGGGLQTRSRLVSAAALNGVAARDFCGATREGRLCHTQPCTDAALDCAVSEWSAWSECSAECGDTGVRRRTRTREGLASNGGTCPGLALELEAPCNRQPCPVDCQRSPFGPWGVCSQPCGGGFQTRVAFVSGGGAQQGGTACGAVQDSRACNEGACGAAPGPFAPVSCQLGAWPAWGECSETACTQSRERPVSRAPSPDAAPCPPRLEHRSCADPVACLADGAPPASGGDESVAGEALLYGGVSFGAVLTLFAAYLLYKKCSA